MKNLLPLLMLSIFTVSCTSEEKTLEFNEANLIGTWKLVEAYADPGDGSGTYHPVPNGYTFTLNNDGSFTSERISQCESGTYRVEVDRIFFIYDCPDYSETYEDLASFEGSRLVTMPLSPLVCIEGCGSKFKKK
jgi:hypothetical protein